MLGHRLETMIHRVHEHQVAWTGSCSCSSRLVGAATMARTVVVGRVLGVDSGGEKTREVCPVLLVPVLGHEPALGLGLVRRSSQVGI